MTTFKSRKAFLPLIAFSVLILFYAVFPECVFAETGKWTVASKKFSYARGQSKTAVSDSTAELLSADIMEKMSRSLKRNVMPDELSERTLYKLRTERQSLYLQLSSEYKKRDALFLNDYSEAKLKSSIKDQEKKIQEIQKKIDANLLSAKNEALETEKKSYNSGRNCFL